MSPEIASGPKADILIIDDTPDNLRLLNQMLSAAYKVRLAPSGAVGLTAARAMPPDLILLDVMMPDVNGFELAAQLKAEPLTADIPLIFISALDDTDSKVRGFAAGGVDFVTKPFQEKEVLARINTHLTLRNLHRRLQAELADRRQTENALRESELLYESLVEVSPLCICRKDLAGRFTFANRRFLDETQITLADLIGQTDFDLHPPELAEKYRRDESGVAASGQVWELIEERVLLDGKSTIVQSIKTPIYDGAGKVIGVQTSFWDITDRKRAEEALRASNATLETLIQVSPLAIVLLDDNGTVQIWNHAAERIFGWTAQEVVGHPNPIVPPGKQDEYALWSNQVRHGTPLANVEAVRQRKDGALIDVSLSSAPIYDAVGNITGRMAIIADITERKQAEAALRELNAELERRVADRTRDLTSANERLAELSSLKTEFITRISHELRTPLANIKLYLQLLEHGKPEKREPYFQTLREQTDRLQHLIEDLLDISQLSLDEIGVQATTFDVTALLREIISDATAVALERGLTLAAIPAPDRPTLHTDCSLLRQALSNVLANALNYTPRTGRVTLRTDRVALPTGEWLAIHVQDTGPGITDHDLPHIFEPFYRGAAAASYKIPGTGVGLSVAQHLIERLGGRITVESAAGQGATFTLWLNAALP
jgi:PAS domain S-box-containing protein